MHVLNNIENTGRNARYESLIGTMPRPHQLLAKWVCPLFSHRGHAVLLPTNTLTEIFEGKHNDGEQSPPSFDEIIRVLNIGP